MVWPNGSVGKVTNSLLKAAGPKELAVDWGSLLLLKNNKLGTAEVMHLPLL